MLHKFRHLYPQGSLLSELVNLEQGLYVVKVTVKNQDVIWGSGLAAAETVEKAEDQARVRALMTLFTTETPQNTDNSGLTTTNSLQEAATNNQSGHNKFATPLQQHSQPAQTQPNPIQPAQTQLPQNGQIQATDNNIPASFNPNSLTNNNLANNPANQGEPSINQSINPGRINTGKANPVNNQTPEVANSQLPQQNGQDPGYSPNNFPVEPNPTNDLHFAPEIRPEVINQETVAPTNNVLNNLSTPTEQTPINIFDQPINSPPSTTENTATQLPSTENAIEFDFNEIKYKIDLEMKRLGWTNEQGRDYLLSTYGKRSRLHLKDEELLEFWRYLETLP